MRIMLVGGAGFIGINIAKSLIQAGFYVVIVDRNLSHLKNRESLPGVSGFYDFDIADMESVIKLVDELSIDCVVNLVSTLIPSSSFDAFSSEIISSIVPAFRLVQDLAERKIKYVFFSSGGTIYGRNNAMHIAESDICLPINFYGYSKQLFEEYLGFINRVSGLDYLVIRPSNPYGMYQSPTKKQGIISVVLYRILKGETIEIWGDGSVVRDYIWVNDMANAFARILAKDAWNNVFNIGSGVGHSLNEVVAITEVVTGLKAKIVYKEARSVDVQRIVLDVSKLKNEIDFYPISLGEGISLYYETYDS